MAPLDIKFFLIGLTNKYVLSNHKRKYHKVSLIIRNVFINEIHTIINHSYLLYSIVPSTKILLVHPKCAKNFVQKIIIQPTTIKDKNNKVSNALNSFNN